MALSEHIQTIKELAAKLDRTVRVMEVCGTHTMTAFRSGLRSLLPENVLLISGPGCPVCVTSDRFIDHAITLSRIPGMTIATFGDMLCVPGTESSLEKERADGASIKIIYSPADALNEAVKHPENKVIFLGIGFETTAPTVAWTIKKAAEKRVSNYMVLCGHKTIPPAMEALLRGGDTMIDGFMCPGHVSAIIGFRVYAFISRNHRIPCVVTGFEPIDMILAIEMILTQIVEGRAEVENQYTRGVTAEGNVSALAMINGVFEECDSEWRGLGVIPSSGLAIRKDFSKYDAEISYPAPELPEPYRERLCICGDILRGVKTPIECGLFRNQCTPATPAGACMVSSEGTCAAYYKYSLRQAD